MEAMDAARMLVDGMNVIGALASCDDPAARTVVTSDRALRQASSRLGATVLGASALRARLDEARS